MYFINNIHSETYSFVSDGYAIVLSKNDVQPTTYSFANGQEYNYKKFNDKISFKSKESGNIDISNDSVIHY